jgi:dTDP-4-amino-4,6-dideoxygalactose transaminase
MNFRMTELSGAVLLAQVRKLDRIRTHLRANKAIVKEIVGEVPGVEFRRLTDEAGDLATHLVVTMPTVEIAAAIAKDVGSITLAESGWHVYARMDHLVHMRTVSDRGCPFDCACTDDGEADYAPGSLPCTDDLLARSISIGIGVRDANLAPYGLRMRDDAREAERIGREFSAVARRQIHG